jgi:DNA-binding response OmpR family regulator
LPVALGELSASSEAALRLTRHSGFMWFSTSHARAEQEVHPAMRILLVHGSPESELTRQLSRAGHELLVVDADNRAARFVGVFAPDVILIVSAEAAGVCISVRSATPDLAIVAVLPGRSVDDRVAVLEAGADDCLGSPFHDAELFARLRAAVRLRRSPRRVSSGSGRSVTT